MDFSPISVKEIMDIAKELNNFIKGIKANQSAVDDLKEAQEYIEEQNWDAARGLCERALALTSLDNDIKNRLLEIRGFTLIADRRYEEALKDIESALKIDPKYSAAYKDKGLVLAEMGRYDEAIRCYTNALKIDENYAPALYQMGKALQAKEMYLEAEEYYAKALELDSAYIEVHYELANINNKRGNFESAANGYRNVILYLSDAHLPSDIALKKAAKEKAVQIIEKAGCCIEFLEPLREI